MTARTLTVLGILLLAAGGCSGGRRDTPASSGAVILRVGHFPNITHAQALVARHLSRQGKGWFEQRLGPGVTIEWFVYNAGPSAMEAIFTDALDITYVGPNPALNAYIKSKGEEIRIIAGAARGGSALVVHDDSGIQAPADFRGRRIATPQLGNTQDVACRAWLASHGFKVTQLGGDVLVVPTANADQLQLFQTRNVDAVWTVEPWVSRLELEAGGRIFLEEPEAITTVLVARHAILGERADLVKRFIAAHAGLTSWIGAHAEEARAMMAAELKEETLRAVAPELLERALGRITLTSEISLESLVSFVNAARTAGFLEAEVDLSRLLATSP